MDSLKTFLGRTPGFRWRIVSQNSWSQLDDEAVELSVVHSVSGWVGTTMRTFP
jgi:hypothetical protein